MTTKSITRNQFNTIRDQLASAAARVGGSALTIVYDTDKPAAQSDAWRIADAKTYLEDSEERASLSAPRGVAMDQVPLDMRRTWVADAMSELCTALDIAEVATATPDTDR